MMKEPGTGTQYYTEASVESNDREGRMWREFDRTWVCGKEYFDLKTNELFVLEAVVRKSRWCDTREVEDSPVMYHFYGDRFGAYEYDPYSPDEDPTDRFRERYQSTGSGPL